MKKDYQETNQGLWIVFEGGANLTAFSLCVNIELHWRPE